MDTKIHSDVVISKQHYQVSLRLFQYFINTPGYICEQHNNPSDFFLDVANGENSAIMAQKGKFEQSLTYFNYLINCPHE